MTAMHPARPRPDGARLDAAKAGASFGSAPPRWIDKALQALLAWEDRRRQRLALHHLSDEMLKDIGLSRADIEREVTKPFWMP